MGNPIKYSDLVQPDESIVNLIAQLQDLQREFSVLQAKIRKDAEQLKEALQGVAGATEQGRVITAEGAKKADELAAASQRLAKAQSELGQDIAWYNSKLKEQNQLNALNAKEMTSMAGSYDQMAATLAKVKLQYQQLTAVERNAQEGMELREKMVRLTNALKEYNNEIKEEIRLAEIRSKIRNAEKGSYNQLSAIYTGLKLKINAMGEADEKAVVAKRKLEEQAKAVYQQMIKLQEATGKHTLSVGNYAKSWDGLRFSVFQVVREVPNAAMSMQTFFLAISNNLPIVADEIARVKEENKALAEEGKKGVPVWKQLTSAVLSWQTVMIAGIFLLTKFGAQLTEWISDLLKGGKAAMSFADAVNKVDEKLKESTGNYGQMISKYKEMQAEWKNLSSLKEREKWLKTHNTTLKQLATNVKSVTDADSFFVSNSANVVEAFKMRARAAAAAALAQEKYEEQLKKETEGRNKARNMPELMGGFTNFLSTLTGSLVTGDATSYNDRALRSWYGGVRALKQEAKIAGQEADQYFEYSEKMNRAWKKVLGDPHSGGNNTGRDPRDITKDIEKMIRDVNQALSESVTALMGSGLNHTLSQIDDATQKGINKMEDIRGRIQHWLNNPKRFKLTDAQRESLEALKGLIDLTQGNLSAKGAIDSNNARTQYAAEQSAFESRMQKLSGESIFGLSFRASFAQRQNIIRAEQDAELKGLDDTYKLRQDLIDRGDKDELERLNRYLRERELILRKYDAQQLLLNYAYFNSTGAYNARMAQLGFNSQWRTPSRRQRLAFEYGQNREALMREGANPETSPQRRQEIAAQLQQLGVEYSKAKRPQNIYELMGLELNDEEKQAISTSTSYAMEAMQSLMQLEQAWADKAVENAQRRVDATRNALQIEKEARANGYANNVEYAQKEYEAAKKQQERALKQRAKVQKATIAMQTAEQISSLVTASAQIWRTFSTMGQPWLAPAMIALMWSSFAASKIMAAKMADVQNDKEEYAEGTVELLQGGSHASGNDVDLGVKPNGVRRRAEGGEYFAVINRRNSRKYRRQIPDIINALNRGDFDKRYLTAEQASAEVGKYVAAYDKAGGITLKYERSATDLRRLEDDVRKLREQGERRTAIDSKGRVIEQYKNVRRITNI